jgi:mRNA-degrading endonuclease YafQ of YafQ-DinJ toxin-antitoxin module
MPEISKPLCTIDPDLLDHLRQLPKEKRSIVGTVIESVRQAWGAPHAHSGIGIRNLGSGIYECRIGLNQRLVFQSLENGLYFHFLGTHDEVKRFLRSHR